MEEFGYKTRLAKDMIHAKREWMTQNPALLILDIGLPDGDGKSLISFIRKERLRPIIVLSARSDEKEIMLLIQKHLTPVRLDRKYPITLRPKRNRDFIYRAA